MVLSQFYDAINLILMAIYNFLNSASDFFWLVMINEGEDPGQGPSKRFKSDPNLDQIQKLAKELQERNKKVKKLEEEVSKSQIETKQIQEKIDTLEKDCADADALVLADDISTASGDLRLVGEIFTNSTVQLVCLVFLFYAHSQMYPPG